jgi:hypothetical protein
VLDRYESTKAHDNRCNLLARKQQLLDRLQEGPGPHERDELERLLAHIDTALNRLEESVSHETSDET